MKKKIIFLQIIIFILGLVPLNSSLAITQNQISAEVQIVCPDNYGNWFSGSGTIIDPKGIILTNKHVVTDEIGGIIKTCFIGFIESINQEPNFGTTGNYNLAEVKYYTTTDDMDAAVLYLDNTTNKIYPYVDIWNSNSSNLQFGDKIEAIGYPSVGGSTITYTSGDFSGFGSLSDGTQNYIKATTPLEHGNSGGAAYNPSGKFIGIPSMVVAGSLNSLSYVLSVDSIKNWLSGVLGSNYQQEIVKQEPIVKKPTVNIQNDVTPPNFNVLEKLCYKVPFQYANMDVMGIGGRCFPPKLGQAEEFNHLQFSIDQYYLKDIDPSGLKRIYYYFDKIPHNEIDENAIQYVPKNINDNEISITQWIDIKYPGKYYFSFFGEDNYGNISNSYIYEYVYVPKIDSNFINKLKGKILLQVESRGEAWYVNPADGQRYYMKDGSAAYQMMRVFSLGITDENLHKIPSVANITEMKNSTSICTQNALANQLKGKILLQVESHGETWYVDPVKCRTIYMKDGTVAYDIMRFLGLGITNNDLSKIPEGSL